MVTWCTPDILNLLKPNGYVMHKQFNIQQLYALPTHCTFVFCVYLRTNRNLCHFQHKLIGFYNRDEKCLLRGTDWVFNYSGLRFVCKGIMFMFFVFIWEQTATCATYSTNWLVFIIEMKVFTARYGTNWGFK